MLFTQIIQFFKVQSTSKLILQKHSNSTKQSPSWEADSCPASQEFLPSMEPKNSLLYS
jgi:hypothetical protein